MGDDRQDRQSPSGHSTFPLEGTGIPRFLNARLPAAARWRVDAFLPTS